MECPSCGSINQDGNRFCGDCGAPLTRRCRVCGQENPGDKRFCRDCGTSLTVVSCSERSSIVAAPGYSLSQGAERAVRAGLEIVSRERPVSAAPDGRLQVRVGIATGLVVVGDLVGAGEARERGVVGETPNLAARLQTLAEPGSVVIAASTHKLIGGIFECKELGKMNLKGFPAPTAAWHVLAESAIESRFDALHLAAALTPLVGREEDIELLLRRWTQTKDGEGQVVLLTGEPGIGKSRLSNAFQKRLP